MVNKYIWDNYDKVGKYIDVNKYRDINQYRVYRWMQINILKYEFK